MKTVTKSFWNNNISIKKENQPKIKIPLSYSEYFLEFFSVSLLVYMLVHLIISWNYLPDKIPTHFGISGEPDKWGSKYSITIIPVISLLLYIGLTFLRKYPHKYNYLLKITEDNAKRQYFLARQLICMLKFEILVLFSFLNLMIVSIGLGESKNINILSIPAGVGIITVTVVVYFIRSTKAR